MYPTAKPRQDGASERYRPCTISIWKVLETTNQLSGVRSIISDSLPVSYIVRSPIKNRTLLRNNINNLTRYIYFLNYITCNLAFYCLFSLFKD